MENIRSEGVLDKLGEGVGWLKDLRLIGVTGADARTRSGASAGAPCDGGLSGIVVGRKGVGRAAETANLHEQRNAQI